jgi:hypothetical protein
VFWSQFVRLTISPVISSTLHPIVQPSRSDLARSAATATPGTGQYRFDVSAADIGQPQHCRSSPIYYNPDSRSNNYQGLNCDGVRGQIIRHCACEPSKRKNASRRGREVRFHPEYPAEAGSLARDRSRPCAGQGPGRKRRLRRRPESTGAVSDQGCAPLHARIGIRRRRRRGGDRCSGIYVRHVCHGHGAVGRARGICRGARSGAANHAGRHRAGGRRVVPCQLPDIALCAE